MIASKESIRCAEEYCPNCAKASVPRLVNRNTRCVDKQSKRKLGGDAVRGQFKAFSQVLDRIRWSPFVLGFMFLFLTGSVTAQVDQGTITGVIADTNGAVIPWASVDVLNLGTGRKTHASTDANGVYTIPPLCVTVMMLAEGEIPIEKRRFRRWKVRGPQIFLAE